MQRHRTFLRAPYKTSAGAQIREVNETNLETLLLLLPRGRQLHPILDAFMSFDVEIEGERAEDGTRTSSS